MYDIQFFFEDNWQIWARLKLWDEIIYALWNDFKSLFEELSNILEDFKEDIDKSKLNKIYTLLSVHQCH